MLIVLVVMGDARVLTLFPFGSGATSVRYLSVEGLVSAVQAGISSHQDKEERITNANTTSSRKVGHCTACLTGKYPVELEW